MKTIQNEINRLNFEDWIFVIFIVVAILNIYGDQLQKKYINENNPTYQIKANKVYLVVIIITILIYIYFVKRNYNLFIHSEYSRKKTTGIKFLGSILLLIGSICLLYFQLNENDFIGAPNI